MSNPTLQELSGGLDGEQLRILSACFVTRGKGKNRLKASKPFASKDCMFGKDDATFKGMVNYVWRMLCFDYLPAHPHCCMPVTADWDLTASFPRIPYGSEDSSQQRAIIKALRDRLDLLVKTAEMNLPMTAQAGVMRWGRTLGVVQ